MNWTLLLLALWGLTLTAAVPHNHPSPKHPASPDCATKPKTTHTSTKITTKKTTSTAKKTTSSTKKITSSTKKTSATTTKKTSTTSTKKTSATSTKKTSTASTKKTSTTSTKKTSTTATSIATPKPSSVSSNSAPSISTPSVSIPSVSVSVPVTSTVPDPPVCPVGNAVKNGGFADGGANWYLGNAAGEEYVPTDFAAYDGTDTDPTNTNSFMLQSLAGDSSFPAADITLSQSITLCPGTLYSYSFHIGIDPKGLTGSPRCGFAFKLNGVSLETGGVCDGASVPNDYGSCVEPTAADPAVRYQTIAGTFTADTAVTALDFAFTCYYKTEQDNPAALLDNLIIVPVT